MICGTFKEFVGGGSNGSYYAGHDRRGNDIGRSAKRPPSTVSSAGVGLSPVCGVRDESRSGSLPSLFSKVRLLNIPASQYFLGRRTVSNATIPLLLVGPSVPYLFRLFDFLVVTPVLTACVSLYPGLPAFSPCGPIRVWWWFRSGGSLIAVWDSVIKDIERAEAISFSPELHLERQAELPRFGTTWASFAPRLVHTNQQCPTVR